jgi:polyisoprenoid-binding protein YceI
VTSFAPKILAKALCTTYRFGRRTPKISALNIGTTQKGNFTMKAHSRLFTAVLLSVVVLSPSAFGQAAADITPAKVQEGAYTVEPTHTRVLFAVSHMGFTTWYGEFTDVSGTLNLTPKSVGNSTLEIHIPTKTISTSNAKLDGELKSPQWLDAGKFPEIVFKSREVERTGEASAKVTGDLTLHGVTKPVTLDVTFNGAGTNPIDKKYTAGFEVSGAIKRSDFGVNAYVPLIGDDVKITISAGFEHSEKAQNTAG